MPLLDKCCDEEADNDEGFSSSHAASSLLQQQPNNCGSPWSLPAVIAGLVTGHVLGGCLRGGERERGGRKGERDIFVFKIVALSEVANPEQGHNFFEKLMLLLSVLPTLDKTIYKQKNALSRVDNPV